MSAPDLFGDALPVAPRPTPAQAPPAVSSRPAFPYPRPTVSRPLTEGERACACGLAATCGMGGSWTCAFCAPSAFWPQNGGR